MTSILASSTFHLRRASGGLLARLGLRKPWPQPEDLDRMSYAEREAFFRHLSLDRTIAASLTAHRAERSTSSEPPTTPA